MVDNSNMPHPKCLGSQKNPGTEPKTCEKGPKLGFEYLPTSKTLHCVRTACALRAWHSQRRDANLLEKGQRQWPTPYPRWSGGSTQAARRQARAAQIQALWIWWTQNTQKDARCAHGARTVPARFRQHPLRARSRGSAPAPDNWLHSISLVFFIFLRPMNVRFT